MIVISEYRLNDDELENYIGKGIRCAVSNGKDMPIIYPGEAVKFILNPERLYKCNIEKIEYLLNAKKSKHNVTVLLVDKRYINKDTEETVTEGTKWILTTPEEWKHTYQDEHDQLKQVTVRHPVLELYREKTKEYFAAQKAKKSLEQYLDFSEMFNTDILDAELDSFVRAFAHLYDLQVDYNSRLDMLYAYYQIKYYLDNDIEYANEVKAIAIEDEPMFRPEMFDLSKVNKFDNQVEVIPVGDETLFEDLVYKCKNSAKLIDEVIDKTLNEAI